MTLRARSVTVSKSGHIEAFAPAKINLWLEITGRRSDGYHLIDSLFLFAGVGDRLQFEPAKDLTLTIDGDESAALLGSQDQDNLILKAARKLQDMTGVRAGAQIRLEKVLPISSGIGGGSTDAAATLLGLSALWSVALDQKTLREVAVSLGADVPSCLFEGPLHVTGIGEQFQPVQAAEPFGLLLVNPRVAVSTPHVFQAYRDSGARFTPALPNPSRLLLDGIRPRTNALQGPACTLAPEIETCLSLLGSLDGVHLARMSGSGATCFALLEDPDAATRAAAAVRHMYPDWWVWGGAPELGLA